MRLAWLTDLHFDFAEPDAVDSLFADVRRGSPDAVVVTGDIAIATDVCFRLKDLDAALGLPIHFVLGNHDFYGDSFVNVREKVRRLCSAVPILNWLSESNVVALTPNTGLVGHDGWGDARLGQPERWRIMLSDWELIAELRPLSEPRLLQKLHDLGDEAAERMRTVLPEALERFPEVIVATHVPPFREACWHQGRISDDDWLPHFTCKAVGDVLKEAMAGRPDRRMTVLCGHTHGSGEAEILPNLRVVTGGAVYGRPELQRVLEVR
jgi:3',5'-cyclic-AMP phosphodiesterase